MKMIRFTPLVFVLAALFFCSQEASAQVEIGVKVSPSITSTRTIARDQYNFKNDGARASFGMGIIADYFFGANYAFSSGLLYNAKGGEVAYDYITPDAMGVRRSGSDDINLQYLEIPLTIKLFTNEISDGTRLYFQAGGSLNTMLAAKVNDRKVDNDSGDRFTKRFNTFEIGALVSAGAEWDLGQSTKLFGGLSYHRGLTDIDNGYYSKLFNDNKVELKNSSVALDFGIKF